MARAVSSESESESELESGIRPTLMLVPHDGWTGFSSASSASSASVSPSGAGAPPRSSIDPSWVLVGTGARVKW